MIALDTSAIVAIVRNETERDAFTDLIAREGAIIGAPTLLELHMVLNRKLEGGAGDFLERFVVFQRKRVVRGVDFSVNMMQLAHEAFDRYGKGQRNPAGLNFGDCMSYAVAKYHDLPLLFKGADFLCTDVAPAYLPPA
jgi:ribonuclease VapC